jgi:hypothetical protein
MAKIIQFIHPGSEHSFDNCIENRKHKNWNSSDHKRKFCKANGEYIGIDNKNYEGEIMFWSEWEPPSFVELTNQSSPLPRYLHIPYLPKDNKGNIIVSGTQNTDPCIFGDYFKYFLCQQIRNNGKLTQMAHLQKGDMILFGSGKNKRFIIDTVFIVDTNIDILNVEHEYIDTAINRSNNYASLGCKIYKGKTFVDNEIFSFVPASENYFGRIEIPNNNTLLLNNYITNTLTQGRKVSEVDEPTVQKVWEELKNLAQSQGLLLAHKIKWPNKILLNVQSNLKIYGRC